VTIGRINPLLLTVTFVLTACGSSQPTPAQTPRQIDARASASRDSSIYAAFFETVNRDPQRDTIYVEEMSAPFPGVSQHYDSVAPGLAQALQKASTPRRLTALLHIPPPLRILSDSAVKRMNDADLIRTLGVVKGQAQGPMGLWSFSPIVYSADGNDAMFHYGEDCGHTCGEQTLVWARKGPGGRWDIRRTAILVIY
jgi:hypothetical protein